MRMYLREEIQAEALVRNLPGFARFLNVASRFHGQTLNISGLARDAGVQRNTVDGYLELLEDTLLAFRLPAFEGRLRVRERKHPKLYWIDAGLVRALTGKSGPPGPEERGHLLEGLVAMMLRAYIEYRRMADDLSFWSPAEARNVEVDFLIRRGAEFVALEVKATPRLDDRFLKGLRAVGTLQKVVRRILLYAGDRPLRTPDGIDILDWASFREALEGGTLLP